MQSATESEFCRGCRQNPRLYRLCAACAQMSSIMRRFAFAEWEGVSHDFAKCRLTPSVLHWEIAALCKTNREITLHERRFLIAEYKNELTYRVAAGELAARQAARAAMVGQDTHHPASELDALPSPESQVDVTR